MLPIRILFFWRFLPEIPTRRHMLLETGLQLNRDQTTQSWAGFANFVFSWMKSPVGENVNLTSSFVSLWDCVGFVLFWSSSKRKGMKPWGEVWNANHMLQCEAVWGDGAPQCRLFSAGVAVAGFELVSALCCEKNRARVFLKVQDAFFVPVLFCLLGCIFHSRVIRTKLWFSGASFGGAGAEAEELCASCSWCILSEGATTSLLWHLGTLWVLCAMLWVISLLHYPSWIFRLVQKERGMSLPEILDQLRKGKFEG